MALPACRTRGGQCRFGVASGRARCATAFDHGAAFGNLGNAEDDYFADGITESLTTDLSRIPDAFVIARATAFSYKGKAIDVRQLGRELGVRYVLEGSIQGRADRVRFNAQLLDAEFRGAHLGRALRQTAH